MTLGDSRVLYKSADLTANPTPLMRRASLGRPLKKHVKPVIYKGTFFGKSGFTESSYVNIISGKFTGNERGVTSSS